MAILGRVGRLEHFKVFKLLQGYKSVIGLCRGTKAFMTAHAVR